VLPPDAVVPDIHDAVEVKVGGVPAVRGAEVLPPDPVVPDIDEAVIVDITT
jgi:hypothetical protein